MGCGASTAKPSQKYAAVHGEEVEPKQSNFEVGTASSATTSLASSKETSRASSRRVTPRNSKEMPQEQLSQGHHWAEGSPGKERRVAQRPWNASSLEPTCEVCESVDTDAPRSFDFQCTFPMMVMKMETFMALDKMKPYEEMIASGDVFEWNKAMGGVFFLSHQWTSFSHPDPMSEQLDVAQKFLGKIRDGKIRSLFATDEEWKAFHYKESNRFLQFDPVGEEEMANDVSAGYVWLDFASVPQAASAEEARLRAIDSIPYYVDHALCFLAIVPKVEHKDLPGTYCTYKSWQERGWCRLETQVHELRLFIEKGGELMPGVPKLDLPRRPLIVHSADYATTYDMVRATPRARLVLIHSYPSAPWSLLTACSPLARRCRWITFT